MRRISPLLFVATLSSAIVIPTLALSQTTPSTPGTRGGSGQRATTTPTGTPPTAEQPSNAEGAALNAGPPGSQGALPGDPETDVPQKPRVSLAETVKRALAKNPNAQTAEEEIHRVYALMEEARAASLPTFNANGTYNRIDSDRMTAGIVTVPGSSLNANLMLSVPIIAPQRWVQWDRAGEQLEVTRASAKDIQRSVAIATARAYLTTIAQRRLLAAAELARANAKGHFDYAHARLVGGIGNRIDEVRAAQELQTDEAQVQSSATGVIRAREALSVLAGSDETIDALSDTMLAEPPPQPAVSEKTLDDRVDIAARHRAVKAADRLVSEDWTDYMPYLTGNAYGIYQAPPTSTQPRTGWQVQLLLTVPLYDGGYRYGLAKERRALADEAHTALEGALRQAKSDVRTGYEALQRAEAGLDAARKAAHSAKEALDLANIAYRAGAVTNIEVIDAERDYRDAEVNAAVSEDTERQAKLDVLAAAGVFP